MMGPAGAEFSDAVLDQIVIEGRYAGYLVRQQKQIDRFRSLEALPLPLDLDYAAIRELRAEAREKLATVMPRTLDRPAGSAGSARRTSRRYGFTSPLAGTPPQPHDARRAQGAHTRVQSEAAPGFRMGSSSSFGDGRHACQSVESPT